MNVTVLTPENLTEFDPASCNTYRIYQSWFATVGRFGWDGFVFYVLISGAILWAPLAAFHHSWSFHEGLFENVIGYGVPVITYPLFIFNRRSFLDIGPDGVSTSETGRTVPYSSIFVIRAYRARRKTGDQIVGYRGNLVFLAVGPYVANPTGVVCQIAIRTRNGCEQVDRSYVLDPPTILELLARRIAKARNAMSWADIIEYDTNSP
jgi:hypothetical protein